MDDLSIDNTKETWYQEIYDRGFEGSGIGVPVFVRSWQTEWSKKFKNFVLVIVKFNDDWFIEYICLKTLRKYPASINYSYEGMLNYLDTTLTDLLNKEFGNDW